MSLHDKWLQGGCLVLLAIATVGAAAPSSPLADAVKERNDAVVRKLLASGADVNVPLVDGTTALHWAVYWNDVKTIELLIRAGANVNASNRYGATPLWLAAREGNADIVERLLKAGANARTAAVGGEPVLLSAARAGNPRVVKALLDGGADVNARESRHGQTALIWAVGGLDPHPEIAQLLIEHGADVTVRSDGGLTALLFAVRQGDLQSTKLLVEAGADVNDRALLPGGKPLFVLGESGWTMPSADTSTALILAIQNDNYDIALYLLDKGADPNAASQPYPYRTRPNISVSGEAFKPGLAPLHVVVYRRSGGRGAARGRGDDNLAVLRALLAHGANPNARTASIRAPEPLQVSPQPAITHVEVGGVTPFWMAANAGDLEAMRVLVEAGADPRAKSMEETTPLMVAVGLGFRTRGPSGAIGRRIDLNRQGMEVARQLLEWGADINAVNKHGQTALHGAAFGAAPKLVEFLLAQGARADLRDSMGRRPVEVAEDNKREEYRPTLQNYDPEDVEQTIEILRKATGN